jgi:hypothetical protein
MKHLTKFVNYIIESKGIISNEDFDALIIPFLIWVFLLMSKMIKLQL